MSTRLSWVICYYVLSVWWHLGPMWGIVSATCTAESASSTSVNPMEVSLIKLNFLKFLGLHNWGKFTHTHTHNIATCRHTLLCAHSVRVHDIVYTELIHSSLTAQARVNIPGVLLELFVNYNIIATSSVTATASIQVCIHIIYYSHTYTWLRV